MLLVVAVNALMFHALPRLSRPDILFSVTVPGAFASSGEAAAVVRRYRTVVWLSTLVLVSVMMASPARDGRAAVVGMHIAAIFGAWAWANRRVRRTPRRSQRFVWQRSRRATPIFPAEPCSRQGHWSFWPLLPCSCG